MLTKPGNPAKPGYGETVSATVHSSQYFMPIRLWFEQPSVSQVAIALATQRHTALSRRRMGIFGRSQTPYRTALLPQSSTVPQPHRTVS